MRSLGVDVGVRRGLDLVLLDETGEPVETHRRVTPEELAAIVAELGPDVVAIDSPPGWALSGRSRLTERELRWFGIQSFNTPSDAKKAEHPFYGWMTMGFEAFRAIEGRYPRYRSGPVKGTAIEVFPHATAVVLAGCLPPPSVAKREWRRSVLRACGVDADGLRSMDQVDAALAALTGLLALEGRFSAPGDPREGQIVVPARTLPAKPYRRGTRPEPEIRQPPLPGLAKCACGAPGCVSLTGSEFTRGHDAKRKSLLWARARAGDEAAQELRRRGWELPPEMR